MIDLTLEGRSFVPGRVFCIGRNYAEHARELGNPLPDAPVVFMKPASSLVPVGEDIPFPRHGRDLQFEAEIVLLLDRPVGGDAEVVGVSLGLDLTLRDLQAELKAKGLPWERAKAFEHSAALGAFTPVRALPPLNALRFECLVNDQPRQNGNSADMLYDVERILHALGEVWRLQAGDLVYTGTPPGVGGLQRGDRIEVRSPNLGRFDWRIV